MSTPPSPLRAWLDQAWDRHATDTAAVAAELLAHAPTLPDDADGAGVLRLAAHVLLTHAADAAAMQRLLDAAPPHAALEAAARPARWALARLQGTPAPACSDAERWNGLEYLVLVLAARGQAAQAQALLLAEEAAAAAHPEQPARRAYAASANNVAGALRDGPRGDAAIDTLMLAAARLSRRAWVRAGTWMHVERADYQLAMCHAALGQAADAVAHAQACLQRCEAEGAAPDELFFAHECAAHAQHAASDTAALQHHVAQMQALLARIEDAGMRQFCAETLARTPAPAAP
ncbi:hypothetical protein ACPOLB_14850 [Rubrivivax sp. RP6-9]|uniref:hypothetical protein n=1 Tax=Rubrivivax sp. RP6-9 TaxID=3415750 RepID=UPI003CC60186